LISLHGGLFFSAPSNRCICPIKIRVALFVFEAAGCFLLLSLGDALCAVGVKKGFTIAFCFEAGALARLLQTQIKPTLSTTLYMAEYPTCPIHKNACTKASPQEREQK